MSAGAAVGWASVLLLSRVVGVIVVSQPPLEIPDGLSQALAQRGHARTAEEQQRDQKDQEEVRRLELAHAPQTRRARRVFPC